MRKIIAIAAALAVLGTPGVAFAHHKDGHPVPPGHANRPAPAPDCAIEVDPLGICIG